MYRFFALIALTIVILMSGSALAAPLRASEATAYDLALTTLTVSPASPRAGDEVTFDVAYINRGTAPMPEVLTATFTIVVTALGPVGEPPQTIGKPCAEVVPLVAGLGPGSGNNHAFTTCSFKFPLEGQYRLTATAQLVDANNNPLPESADNNVIAVDSFHVDPFQTALPDQFARLFAGLGIFMAVMAIVAVGTETVIDSAKLALGLKSKVNALDALKDMEKLLPGQLAGLGVGATQQQQLKKLTSDLSASLEPVQDLATQLATIQKGDFQPVYEAILAVEQQSQLSPADRLRALKAAASQALTRLEAAAQRLGLAPSVSAALKTKLAERLDQINVDDVQQFAVKAFEALQAIMREMPDKWLEAQRDTLVTKSHSEVSTLFRETVKPLLETTGLSADTVNAMTNKFDASLALIDTQALAATDTYIASLSKLLDGVQARRNSTQSPARKLWRRLRDSRYADLVLCILAGVVTAALLWLKALGTGQDKILAMFPGVPGSAGMIPAVVFALIWGVVAFLITGGALRLLGTLGQSLYARYLLQRERERADPNAKSLRLRYFTNGHHINDLSFLHRTELLWSLVRGADTLIDPDHFGDPDPIETLTNTPLTATNAAQVVLSITDEQRDEEDTRLHLLRAIAVLVGLVLAYLLQVDAAVLLEAAIPGISRSINLFVITGEQLHHLWPILRPELNLTPGIFLTALAASAGSAFWHDQLDRLQATKNQAEGAAQALKQIKDLTGHE